MIPRGARQERKQQHEEEKGGEKGARQHRLKKKRSLWASVPRENSSSTGAGKGCGLKNPGEGRAFLPGRENERAEAQQQRIAEILLRLRESRAKRAAPAKRGSQREPRCHIKRYPKRMCHCWKGGKETVVRGGKGTC